MATSRVIDQDIPRSLKFLKMSIGAQACFLFLYCIVPVTGIGEYDEETIRDTYGESCLNELVKNKYILIDKERSIYYVPSFLEVNKAHRSSEATIPKFKFLFYTYNGSPLVEELKNQLMNHAKEGSGLRKMLSELKPGYQNEVNSCEEENSNEEDFDAYMES